MDDVTGTWVAGACVVAVAAFVQGLAGFGIGLVALAFLPFLMSPDTAIVLMTVYTVVFSTAMFVPLRKSFLIDGMGGLDGPPKPPDARRAPAKPWRSSIMLLVLGSVIGTPLGVWLLATLPASVLNRTIGAVVVIVVLLEWLGVYPERLHGRRWALGAGLTAGVIGAAVGTPGPPVVVYMASQGWSPRTIKANLQAFFVVNQVVILAGYWWAGLLTAEVGRFSVLFAVPAVVGIVTGMALFDRIDQVRFRKIVFTLLFVSGLALLVRG
jgi:uncharacterized protein